MTGKGYGKSKMAAVRHLGLWKNLQIAITFEPLEIQH
jgi:hypothetical protein